MTPKDRADLNFMLDLGVDWIALSFVQRPEDIVEMKGLIMSHNPNNAFPPHIMAKIEKVSFRRVGYLPSWSFTLWAAAAYLLHRSIVTYSPRCSAKLLRG